MSFSMSNAARVLSVTVGSRKPPLDAALGCTAAQPAGGASGEPAAAEASPHARASRRGCCAGPGAGGAAAGATSRLSGARGRAAAGRCAAIGGSRGGTGRSGRLGAGCGTAAGRPGQLGVGVGSAMPWLRSHAAARASSNCWSLPSSDVSSALSYPCPFVRTLPALLPVSSSAAAQPGAAALSAGSSAVAGARSRAGSPPSSDGMAANEGPAEAASGASPPTAPATTGRSASALSASQALVPAAAAGRSSPSRNSSSTQISRPLLLPPPPAWPAPPAPGGGAPNGPDTDAAESAPCCGAATAVHTDSRIMFSLRMTSYGFRSRVPALCGRPVRLGRPASDGAGRAPPNSESTATGSGCCGRCGNRLGSGPAPRPASGAPWGAGAPSSTPPKAPRVWSPLPLLLAPTPGRIRLDSAVREGAASCPLLIPSSWILRWIRAACRCKQAHARRLGAQAAKPNPH
eukprot:21216-Chlamydomonas_euryale.AAC.23